MSLEELQERLRNITFFDESKFTPVVLEDINTVRKIFNYDFNDEYFLFDFFEDTETIDADIHKIDGLCREMRAEIKMREMKRESNELETGREVTRMNNIETMSEDYARRLWEYFSSSRPLPEVSGITVTNTNENTANVRGTWFVG